MWSTLVTRQMTRTSLGRKRTRKVKVRLNNCTAKVELQQKLLGAQKRRLMKKENYCEDVDYKVSK